MIKQSIVVPNTPLYSRLLINVKQIAAELGYNLVETNETNAYELSRKNRASLSLMTPLGYGKGLMDADYRIIPGPALISTGYTRLASFFFREGLKDVNSIGSPSPNDFLMIIGKILLLEKYGIRPKIKEVKGTYKDILKECELAISWEPGSANDLAMDISEEWFISYEKPLPVAFWVVRNEEEPSDVMDFVNAIASPNLEPDNISDNTGEFPRTGIIEWQWKDDFENALEYVLHMLFYHQYFEDIPAVKIFGKEEKTKPEDASE